MQVTDESGTYIIEPVSGDEYYSEDPNIMWIQETVEVEQESYDNLPNMVSFSFNTGTYRSSVPCCIGMPVPSRVPCLRCRGYRTVPYRTSYHDLPVHDNSFLRVWVCLK